MPDPLSITTGVATLLKVTWTVGFELKKFCDGAVVVSESIASLQQDVDSLTIVLESMRDTFECITAADGSGQNTSHWSNIARFFEGAAAVLEKLQNQVEEINKPTSFLGSARKQLRLNLAEDRISGFRIQLQSYRDGLQLSLHAILLENQVAHRQVSYQIPKTLNELGRDIRRVAETTGQVRAILQTNAGLGSDQTGVTAIDHLRECVKSAASIVSSASTATQSEVDIHSDFGDCFPEDQEDIIGRWMQTRSVRSWAQNAHAAPPESIADISALSGSDDSEDSDYDLEDEMTAALIERGQEKLADDDLDEAYRILNKCLLRLTHPNSNQRFKSKDSLLKVLGSLFALYERQQKWADAKQILIRRLSLMEPGNRKGDSEYWADVIRLVSVLQRLKDHEDALLHARRALRAYRKLQSVENIRICLTLLVEICNATPNDDDGEAYAILLSRLGPSTTRVATEVAAQQSTHLEGPKDSTGKSPENVVDRENATNPTMAPERRKSAPAKPSKRSDTHHSILKKVHETEYDFVPFVTRPGERDRHMQSRMIEDVSEARKDRRESSRDSNRTIHAREATRDEGEVEDEFLDAQEDITIQAIPNEAIDEELDISSKTHPADTSEAPDPPMSSHLDTSQESEAVARADGALVNDDEQPEPVNDNEQSVAQARRWAEGLVNVLDYPDSQFPAFQSERKPDCNIGHEFETNLGVVTKARSLPNPTWYPTLEQEMLATATASMTAQTREGTYYSRQGPPTQETQRLGSTGISRDTEALPVPNAKKTFWKAYSGDGIAQRKHHVNCHELYGSIPWADIVNRHRHLNCYELLGSVPSENTLTTTSSTLADDATPAITSDEATTERDIEETTSIDSWLRHSISSNTTSDSEATATSSAPGSPAMTHATTVSTTSSPSPAPRPAAPSSIPPSRAPPPPPSVERDENPFADADDVVNETAGAVSVAKYGGLTSSTVSLASTEDRSSLDDAPEQRKGKENQLATIVLVGDGMCGKSALAQRFIFKNFIEDLDVGHHARSVTCEIDGNTIDAWIEVIGGQADFAPWLRKFQDVKCVLACFAIDFPTSLENLVDKWAPLVHQYQRNVPILLVGCKGE